MQYKPIYGPKLQNPQQPQSVQQQQPQSSVLTESQKTSVPTDINAPQPLENSTSKRMDAVPSVFSPNPSVIQDILPPSSLGHHVKNCVQSDASKIEPVLQIGEAPLTVHEVGFSPVEVQMVDEENTDALVAVVDAENTDAFVAVVDPEAPKKLKQNTVVPPVVIPTHNPILPAGALPSVDQPSSVVHLESLTEHTVHDTTTLLPAPTVDLSKPVAPAVLTPLVSKEVGFASPTIIENYPQQLVIQGIPVNSPFQVIDVPSIAEINLSSPSTDLQGEKGQNVAKMKAIIDHHSGEGSSTNLDKFSDAELRLLDDVQYFDPRTGTYKYPQLEDENLVDVPTTVEEDDDDSFQLVKPKRRGRPRKNKDRD